MLDIYLFHVKKLYTNIVYKPIFDQTFYLSIGPYCH